MENININDSVHLFIGIVQYFVVPVFGILVLVGILFFNLSFKNPMKRRTAFLLTTLAPIGFILTLYGPAVFGVFIFGDVPINSEGQNLEVLIEWSKSWRGPVYEVFKILSNVVLVILLIIGIGFLTMAAKMPALKRLGRGIFIGVPFLWLFIQMGPSILNVLTT